MLGELGDIVVWEVGKGTIRPTELDWEYGDYDHTSDIKKVDMEPSIEPDWAYHPKHDSMSTADNRKKKQILCEGE